MDDLDWYVGEAPAEMGEGSTLGAMLERAALEHQWCAPDARDLREKREGKGDGRGHYGRSYSAGVWEEWVVDPKAQGGGYMRRIWGARPHQDTSPQLGSVSPGVASATEMYTNVGAVLALMPRRLRVIALTQHEPRVHGVSMRRTFGPNVKIAVFSESARGAFLAAEGKRAASESTVYAWLEGLALRHVEGKGRPGEKATVEAVRLDDEQNLEIAYATYERARAELPGDRRYPYQSSARRARRLSLVGS
jgi:hypothetical protein